MTPDPAHFSHFPDHWTLDYDFVMRNLNISDAELRELIATEILPPPLIVGRSRGWSVGQLRQSLRRATNFGMMTNE